MKRIDLHVHTTASDGTASPAEAVKLAKRYSHKAGSGFVNGVLRSFAREAETFEFPKGPGETEYLSLKYSYPFICAGTPTS